jgi:hypothetical protein
MPEEKVCPSDCVLAIAVPMTRSAFLEAADSTDRDLVRQLVKDSGSTPAKIWTDLYEPKLVVLARRVAERVRSLGATVLESVTLADFSKLTQSFKVTALFTHFRMAPLEPPDVLDPAACLKVITEGRTIVARKLKERVPQSLLSSDPNSVEAEEVFTLLQGVLATTVNEYGRFAGAATAPIQSPGVSRVGMELCLQPHLRQAPCVELFDGLRTFDQFCEAVPTNYAGVLDLSMCNSVMVAEELKRKRKRALFVENVYLATPEFRLARFALVIRQLANQPARYTDALVRVHRAILESRL